MKGFYLKSGLVFVGLMIFVGILSCAKSSTSTGPAPSPNTITMGSTSFSPSSKTITVGTTITWVNNSGITHTVTSDTGTELNSGNIANGGSYQHTFNTAGTFNYHCVYHQAMGMTGTIVVQ